MVVNQEDTKFQLFYWWRTKICPLGLHTSGQWPTDNNLQNTYMAILFGSFGTMSLFGEKKFVMQNYWKSKISLSEQTFFSLFI
jgi:hypothetical protein